jgi:hypothetical protein
MVVLTKRLKNRWGGQASYVLSTAEGTLDNDFAGSTGASRRYESATMALVNVEGDVINDRRHEVKAGLFYDIPVIDLRASVFYTRLSGRPYTPFQRLTSSSINFPQSSAGRNLLLEPRGSRRRETQNTVLLRLEKFFKVGRDRKDELSFYADVQNLFNDDTVTFVQDRVPNVSIAGVPTPIEFGAPTAIAPARQVTLGARWSF